MNTASPGLTIAQLALPCDDDGIVGRRKRVLGEARFFDRQQGARLFEVGARDLQSAFRLGQIRGRDLNRRPRIVSGLRRCRAALDELLSALVGLGFLPVVDLRALDARSRLANRCLGLRDRRMGLRDLGLLLRIEQPCQNRSLRNAIAMVHAQINQGADDLEAELGQTAGLDCPEAEDLHGYSRIGARDNDSNRARPHEKCSEHHWRVSATAMTIRRLNKPLAPEPC